MFKIYRIVVLECASVCSQHGFAKRGNDESHTRTLTHTHTHAKAHTHTRTHTHTHTLSPLQNKM